MAMAEFAIAGGCGMRRPAAGLSGIIRLDCDPREVVKVRQQQPPGWLVVVHGLAMTCPRTIVVKDHHPSERETRI